MMFSMALLYDASHDEANEVVPVMVDFFPFDKVMLLL
jgi:hypothetical protein